MSRKEQLLRRKALLERKAELDAKPEEPKFEGIEKGTMFDPEAYKGSILEATKDALRYGLPQGTLAGWAQEAEATVKAGIDPTKTYEEVYPEVRQEYAAAVERNPLPVLVGEMAGPNPLGKLKTMQKIPKALKAIGYGTAYGAGESPDDRALGGAMGGALSGTMYAGMAGAKKLFKEPAQKIAQYMGLDAKAVTKAGVRAGDVINEAKGKMKELATKGLFKGGDVKFDPKAGKWVRLEGTKSKILSPKKGQIINRMDQAQEVIDARIDKIIQEKSPSAEKTFPVGGFKRPQVMTKESGGLLSKPVKEMDDILLEEGVYTSKSLKQQYGEKMEDLTDRLHTEYPREAKLITEAIDKELQDLDSQFGITLEQIQNRKKLIYREIENSYKAGSAMDPHKVAAKKGVAKFFKEVIEDNIPEVKKHNAQLSDILRFREPLLKSDVGEFISHRGQVPAGYSAGTVMFDAIKNYVVDKSMPLERAQASMAMEAASPMAQKIMSKLSTEFPQLPTRGMMRDQGGNMSREPQSIEDADYLNQRFPRSTSELLKAPNAFLKKVMVMYPENYDDLRYLITNVPEKELAKVMPQLTKTYPNLFEYDDLNRWDGIVPEDTRPAAISQLMDSNMSNTEKIQKRHLLNKTGKME